ncbi:mandelate racemase/muconate lactonizing enzyme family protein [Paralimibaculum aggregatum]|uniref:Mandelate racemase/muconate lactonizing enzyme family protein n=1 Tax=Paralimibaculum aggregatum TaxID=3036245 RepID=A0ABQ6LIC1_9RHOB|nr:mandelate racemase/muconate lactonizing enzyme family protein [Limibaculum sp. NKW23]GMG83029.1 mandelate racemase/muconate lactonizing enzyme family protein [Limibaculum sp. NKW23]
MRITDVETFAVANPEPGRGGPVFIFVKLSTDAGITGIGEAYPAGTGPETTCRLIEEVAARHLLGRPFPAIEAVWREVYGRGYGGRPEIGLMSVLSALEMALWDILGKEVGKPVHVLLGGRVHERLRSYTYLYPPAGVGGDFYSDPEASAEVAAAAVAEGFTAVKFDPCYPYTVYDGRQPSMADFDRVERFLTCLREAVGGRADLLVGTHGQFTPSGAIRLAERMAPFAPLWFEEPVPPESPEEMARVARASTVPIATGERLATKHEFARVLACGAAAILQPNLGRCGGLLEARKIAALAEVHYAQIAPHLYCGPVVAAANIQFAASIPNFLILESIWKMDGFYAELLETPLAWEDGHVLVPEAPGLGVTLDEAVARAHPWPGGSGLHLEPQERPA